MGKKRNKHLEKSISRLLNQQKRNPKVPFTLARIEQILVELKAREQ